MMNMAKTLSYNIFFLLLFFVMSVTFSPAVYASSVDDCPTYTLANLEEDGNTEEAQAKRLFATMCAGNNEGVGPWNWGPYKVENGEITGLMPVYISDMACDVNDETIVENAAGVPVSADCENNGVTYSNFWVEFTVDASREGIDCDDIAPENWGNQLAYCAEDGETHRLYAGESKAMNWSPFATIEAVREGDKLCLYADPYIVDVQGGGKHFIGCRYMPESTIEPLVVADYVADSCVMNSAAAASHWEVPFSSFIVQCIQDTLNEIFMDSDSGACDGFCAVKQNFQRLVSSILTLYIILIGIKTVLGQYHSQKDVMDSIIKVALVVFFVMYEGWEEYFPALLSGANDLARIVFNASSEYGYCDFSTSQYAAGYSSMALWDAVDCKIFHYLGFTHDDPYYPRLLVYGLASLWSFNILVVIFTIIFLIMMVMIIIAILKSYIMAMIAITILVYLSPLFIPCVLFGPTHKYFDAWKNELIGYTLYPMVLFAFVALLFATFDTMYWGDAVPVANENGAITSVNCGTVDSPIRSLGCSMELQSAGTWNDVLLLDFTYYKVDWQGGIGPLLEMVFFTFLFLHFLDMLGGFAAALTGARSSTAISPQGLGSKISAAVGAAGGKAMAGAAKAVKGGGGAGGGGGGGAARAAAGGQAGSGASSNLSVAQDSSSSDDKESS